MFWREGVSLKFGTELKFDVIFGRVSFCALEEKGMVLALHLTSSFPFSFLKLHPIIYLNIVTYTQFKYNSQLTHLIILVAYTTSTLLKIHMCLISSAHFSSSAPPSLKLNNEAIRAVLLSYYCFNFTISDKN